MGVKENIELVRRGYAAFSAGDAATLTAVFAPDAVHRVPGSSWLAGDHKGAENILKMYGELGERTEGSIKVELEEVLTNGEDQVIAVHRATARRGGKSLDTREALLFTIEGGRVTNIQDFFVDIEENDAFWK
jgi:ketosteroid isomerase-like protein